MISFQPSDDQKLLIETVRRFSRDKLHTSRHDADESHSIAAETVHGGWELGLIPGNLPEDVGGFGESHSVLTGAIYAEELAYGDLAHALHLLAPALVGTPTLLFGTDTQKETYLARLAEDNYPAVTAAFVEERWNFDPAAMQTTARKDGDSYVITGHKVFVPLASESDTILVYANEDGKVQAFFVDKGANGLSVSPREKNMGIGALATYELSLEECRVAVDARLGGEKGIQIETLLTNARVAGSALAVGVAQAALEYATDYAKQREAFGRPIAQFQSIAFMLAEMRIEVDATRLMVWEAAWKLDNGEDATQDAVITQQYADDMALMVTDRAVQILGGHGYIRDNPVELLLRNARGFPAFLGMAMI